MKAFLRLWFAPLLSVSLLLSSPIGADAAAAFDNSQVLIRWADPHTTDTLNYTVTGEHNNLVVMVVTNQAQSPTAVTWNGTDVPLLLSETAGATDSWVFVLQDADAGTYDVGVTFDSACSYYHMKVASISGSDYIGHSWIRYESVAQSDYSFHATSSGMVIDLFAQNSDGSPVTQGDSQTIDATYSGFGSVVAYLATDGNTDVSDDYSIGNGGQTQNRAFIEFLSVSTTQSTTSSATETADQTLVVFALSVMIFAGSVFVGFRLSKRHA